MTQHGTIRGAVACLVSSLLASGCVAGPLTDNGSSGGTQLSDTEAAGLRRDLDAFHEEVKAGIEAAADRVARSAISADARRAAILLKVRVLDRLGDKLREPNPVVAAVDAWVVCLQVRQFIEGEPGAKLFGEDRPIVLEAVRTASQRIEAILANPAYLPPGAFGKLRAGVYHHAGAHPLTGEFRESEPASARLDTGLFGALRELLNLPLAPFRAAEGVKGGAETFREFNKTVADLPKEFRWEAELLLLSVEKSNAAQSALRSFDRLSRGVYTMAQSAERMPEELRKSVDSALDSIDRNKTVRGAMTELKQIGDSSTAVAQVAQKLPETLRQTVDHSVKTTLAAVDENQSAQSALESFARISHSMEQFAKTADTLPDQMQQTATSTVQFALSESRPVIDYIAWWIIRLLLVAGALAAALIVLGRLLRASRRPARAGL